MREKISVGSVVQLTAAEGQALNRALLNSNELAGEMVPIEELLRLRAIEAAAHAVVKDYPVAAGTIASSCADDLGYGSIKALRLALKTS